MFRLLPMHQGQRLFLPSRRGRCVRLRTVLRLEQFEGRALPRFLAAGSFNAGSGPRTVAVADLNGDGIPDLATANNRSGSVSVLLNGEDWPPAAAPQAHQRVDQVHASKENVLPSDLHARTALAHALIHVLGEAVLLCPGSQTPFGNALRETPFRGAIPARGARCETEFRGLRSQTEFGNEQEGKTDTLIGCMYELVAPRPAPVGVG